MALKDLKEYYNKVCDDYQEAIKEIKEIEKEMQTNIMDPQIIDNIKSILNPLIANYQQISYLMFLLNLPNRKNKQALYKKQNKRILEKIDPKNTTEFKLEQNKEVLNLLKQL